MQFPSEKMVDFPSCHVSNLKYQKETHKSPMFYALHGAFFEPHLSLPGIFTGSAKYMPVSKHSFSCNVTSDPQTVRE